MKRGLCFKVFHLFSIVWLSLWSNFSFAEIRFTDVTSSAGINHSGPSRGASWGDFNGDGFPDLWVGNHYTAPSLYQNNGDGTFIDIANDVWPGKLGDAHGAAWADFDRDGDQDLIEITGGGNSNHLYVNESGVFVDKAKTFGVDSGKARSRTPLWLDWDNDGFLDLVLTQLLGNGDFPFMLRNTGFGFEDVTDEVGGKLESSTAAYLSDITEDGSLDLALFAGGKGRSFPGTVYDISNQPFVLREDLTNSGSVASDATFADFNGDLRNDIFVTRESGPQQLLIRSQNRIDFTVIPRPGNYKKSVEFMSLGSINLAIYPGTTTAKIFVGKDGQKPTIIQTPENGHGSFFVTLDPQNTITHGFQEPSREVDKGIYIGFDESQSLWRITFSAPKNAWGVSAILTTRESIQNPRTRGFQASPPLPQPNYYVRTDTGFVDRTRESGFDFEMPCFSTVSGDFDNDMDVDIYLACSQVVVNEKNILLENQGDGTFVLVQNAGGASGAITGRSDSVVTADYNQDGFLDLFVTNGHKLEPFNNGPHQLFRNNGNTNNWIELDLTGIFSNPHGIGAVVKVKAREKTQLREQNGGMHSHAQNFQRIHFGLGKNNMIDEIEIRWPNGNVQILEDISSNQILTVIESSNGFCPQGADDDGDGVPNACDNCVNIPNGPLLPGSGGDLQRDTDGDGFGNLCDGDLNNDGKTNTLDLNLYKLVHRTQQGDVKYNSNADFNSDGKINTVDLNIYRSLHRSPPGPSGLVFK